MKKLLNSLFLATVLLGSWSCQKDVYELPVAAQAPADVVINERHPMKDSIRAIIDKYLAAGIPGVQVAVKNASGWYIANGGYARVEDQTPFQPGTVGWLYSLTKTYTAALVMKMKERERMRLDAPIRDYLPADIAARIIGSDRITVRMLLNHSSGIRNVTEIPAFQLKQLNRPLRQPGVMERIELLYGQPLMFEPGANFYYSNSNFLLLTLMLEQVSGQSYGDLLRKEILEPLQLQRTYYDLSEAQQETLPFPNYYFDRYANAQLENVSKWNAALGNSCVGYGGIAGTATDAIRFLEALVRGRVVNQASLQEMRTWIQGKESIQPDYGLGLEYYRYGNGTGQYGHEGDGIGCTTQVMYIPDNDTFLFINITAGRQLFGPYLFKTTDMKHELCGYAAR